MKRRMILKAAAAVLLFPLESLKALVDPRPWIVREAPWLDFLSEHPTHTPYCEYCNAGWLDVFWERENAGHSDPWGFKWHEDEDGLE